VLVIDEERDQPLAALSIHLVETCEGRAVEVEHAPQMTAVDQWHDALGARSRVAGDMARKIVDVGDQNRRGA